MIGCIACTIGDERGAWLGAGEMHRDGFAVEARGIGVFGLISKASGLWPWYWSL